MEKKLLYKQKLSIPLPENLKPYLNECIVRTANWINKYFLNAPELIKELDKLTSEESISIDTLNGINIEIGFDTKGIECYDNLNNYLNVIEKTTLKDFIDINRFFGMDTFIYFNK